MRCKRILLLTPPLVQPNCPYPATTHLAGFLRRIGAQAHQLDLSIKVQLDVLRRYGGDEADEILEVLQNPRLPPEAKLEASAYIEELALWIRDNVDGEFGFSRYAERLSANAFSFGAFEKLVKKRAVVDEPLERHLNAAVERFNPSIAAVTCPFPGTLVGAFKTAAFLKRRHPRIKTVLGGGFVSSELRHMTTGKVKEYFDEVIFDEGYRPLAELAGFENAPVPPFVEPCYDGIELGEYFDVVETENPMFRLWSAGKWKRLIMARGCYWRKCAFCDVRLPYIADCVMPKAEDIVDAMENLGGGDFHFVDEAMPPSLVRAVSAEIIRRGLECRWWGNIRFDGAYTPELCRLMADAGCIAVTGGLECAVDRLLALMNKGITVESARKAMTAFRDAGIMVHAYLMYAFPTQTENEAWEALECVRSLFRDGLIQSAFFHRFALTVHSPIAADPDRFGIEVRWPRRRNVFCLNELGFHEPGAPDWDEIGEALKLALYNYNQSTGLAKPVGYWKKCRKRQKLR